MDTEKEDAVLIFPALFVLFVKSVCLENYFLYFLSTSNIHRIFFQSLAVTAYYVLCFEELDNLWLCTYFNFWTGG